jgi:DNA-directed RNA polymerase
LDAAHLLLSVNAAQAEGIKNTLSIHDCYATTAPDTTRFAQIRRWQLALMYHTYKPLARLRDNLPSGTNDLAPPDDGLDVLAVGHSEYSDR